MPHSPLLYQAGVYSDTSSRWILYHNILFRRYLIVYNALYTHKVAHTYPIMSISTVSNSIMMISLYAMIFVLPFSISLIEIFFLAMLICWIVKRVAGYERQTSPIKIFKPVKSELNMPIAAFVLFAFLSTLNSSSLVLSLEGFFLKLLEGVAVYFITVETIADERRLNGMLRLLVLSMAVIAVDGIFQLITGTDFIRHFTSGRMIQGPFHSPNGFAGWLLIMVFLALSIASLRKNSRYLKAALWFLTGLLAVCLVSTQSRGAWIAAVSALIFMGALKSRKSYAITAGMAVILFFIMPYCVKGAASWTLRGSLWREALQIIEDFPLLGIGINTYAHIGSRYALTGGGGYYPHNCYLQIAAETGLLGLGAFLWVIVALFRTSLANLKMVEGRFYKMLLAGLLTGLFGFLVHSFVDTNIYTLQLGILMWFTIGLIIATQKIAEEKVG